VAPLLRMRRQRFQQDQHLLRWSTITAHAPTQPK
jgi:hypothetical protein